MAEVLFYRGMVLVLVLLACVILYKVIHPYIKVICDKIESDGQKALKGGKKTKCKWD